MEPDKSYLQVAELAKKLGLSDDQIAREILQAKLLSAMFRGHARQVILKGGLAMRQIYQSPRLTKDVDLSAAPGISTAAVAKTIMTAIDSTLQSGFLEDFKVTAPKQTDVTQRWKVNGRISGGESVVQLTIEVSHRGAPPEEHIATMTVVPMFDHQVSPAIVQVFTPIALAASKVAALVDPKRNAPRDVYDLDVLVSMRVEPPVKLLAGMGSESLGQSLNRLWEKLETLDWKLARSELRNFLPLPMMEMLDEEEWDAMRLRVGTEVERWLDDAKRFAGDSDDEG